MDVYNKPENISSDIVANLGPLAGLAGSWQGDKGIDTSPGRDGAVETKFREQMSFEPVGPVVNGPQILYGLRYSTTAWPIGEDDAFHEELGYWLWDPKDKQVMRCFMVPRGVTMIAGGHAEPQARSFAMTASVGSETYGILSNPFLDKGFKTVAYQLNVYLNDDGSLVYDEDTQLQIHGQADIFHHTDSNTLVRC